MLFVAAAATAVYFEVRVRMQDASVMVAKAPSGQIDVGADAPDFSLPDLTDYPFALSSFRGQKVVVLDFWATWCGYCRQSMPRLQALHEELQSQGVELVSVNQSEAKNRVRTFIDDNNYTFRSVLDINGEVGDLYHVRALPTLIVVDKQGKVRRVFVGAGFNDRDLRKELLALARAR